MGSRRWAVLRDPLEEEGKAEARPATEAGAGPDQRLKFLLWFVVGAGCLTFLSAFVQHPDLFSHVPATWKLALAATGFAFGDIAVLHIRFGHDKYSFTWSESAVIVGLVVLPSPWLRIVAPLAIGTAHLLARRPRVKVVFNATSAATGCLLAGVVFGVITRDTGRDHVALGSPHTWIALAVAAFAFFVWNSVTVWMAVAFSQGRRFVPMLRKGLPLNSLVWVGNTTMGVALVAIAGTSTNNAVLLVVPIFIAFLYLTYRGYLRAMEERDLWQVLQATSRELARVDQSGIAAVVMERAETLFKAEFVELMLVDGEPGTAATIFRHAPGQAVERLEGEPERDAGTFWPRVLCEREPFQIVAPRAPAAQREELESLGLAMCIVAPLIAQETCLGVLRVGFRGHVRLADRELQVLSTFANQVSTSLHNARLFEETNEERAKLSGVFNHSSDGILSVDAAGEVTSWNPAMSRITGTSAADALGAPLFSGLSATTEKGEPVTPEWLRRELRTSSQIEAAVAIQTARAGRRWLQLSASGVRQPGRDDVYDSVVMVARDVTAIRELEETKQDFVATVSHELRTPLTPLKGFLGTLMRPDFNPSPTDLADMHAAMLRQVKRLERIIEDVLNTAQVERGEFRIDAVPVDLGEVVDRLAQECNRPVEYDPPTWPAVALADPGRVEQVLANLLSNAEKYTPPESLVTLVVEHAGAEVVVKVVDQGPGIEEEDQPLVFERFRRLGNHLTRQPGGTGLGLYVSRRLVEAMGGRIWLESEIGEGCTFAFALPGVVVAGHGSPNTSLRVAHPPAAAARHATRVLNLEETSRA